MSAATRGEIYIQGGSPGGARPKVTLSWNLTTGECLSGFTAIPRGFEHWLVKFRGAPEPREVGRIEMAYAQMAEMAGLRIPEARLLEVKVGRLNEAFFATRRFDRVANEKRHVLSLSGYLYADHRAPSVDYQHILAATQRLTRDVTEVALAFRQMVFNVFAHNKDDHAKNFDFIGVPTGWTSSPAFDLTYSAGMGGEHTSSVGGARQSAFPAHVEACAKLQDRKSRGDHRCSTGGDSSMAQNSQSLGGTCARSEIDRRKAKVGG